MRRSLRPSLFATPEIIKWLSVKCWLLKTNGAGWALVGASIVWLGWLEWLRALDWLELSELDKFSRTISSVDVV